MVYGGTKYGREIAAMRSFLRLLGELKKSRRLVKVEDEPIDTCADRLKKTIRDDDFDDEHIVALVSVSKCCVVCTEDTTAITYLRNRKLYPSGVKPPNIYNSPEDAGLCCSRYIADVCRPYARRRSTRKPKSVPKISADYLRRRK
jgi:hypothetical protein